MWDFHGRRRRMCGGPRFRAELGKGAAGAAPLDSRRIEEEQRALRLSEILGVKRLDACLVIAGKRYLRMGIRQSLHRPEN
jgi:hypothetical protein